MLLIKRIQNNRIKAKSRQILWSLYWLTFSLFAVFMFALITIYVNYMYTLKTIFICSTALISSLDVTTKLILKNLEVLTFTRIMCVSTNLGIQRGPFNVLKIQMRDVWKLFSERLRGIAAAKRSLSCINLCLSSCRPMFGGPIRTIGLLWFALG